MDILFFKISYLPLGYIAFFRALAENHVLNVTRPRKSGDNKVMFSNLKYVRRMLSIGNFILKRKRRKASSCRRNYGEANGNSFRLHIIVL